MRRQVDKALRKKVTVNEKLDDALDKSFPASDPVSLGHSDHVGQPNSVQREGDDSPAAQRKTPR